MTRAERMAEGHALLQSLKTRVEGLGGDITDGVSILAIGFMVLHASMFIGDGSDADEGRDDAITMLRENYTDAWTLAARVFAAHAKETGN